MQLYSAYFCYTADMAFLSGHLDDISNDPLSRDKSTQNAYNLKSTQNFMTYLQVKTESI